MIYHYIMVNTHPGRILSDPTKTARLFYTLEPLIEQEPSFLHQHKQKKETLETAKKWAHNKRITSGVKPYRMLHKKIRKRYESLKDKRIMFVSGMSNDQSKEGKQIGYDPFSVRNRLSDELLLIIKDLSEKEHLELDDWIFMSVSPVITPFTIRYPYVNYVFSKEADEIDQMLIADNKKGFGSYSKEYGENMPKKGFWQFSDILFDSSLAQKVMEPRSGYVTSEFKEAIRKGVALNRHLLGIAYATLLDEIGYSGEVDVYSAKTGYAYDIIDLACRYNSNCRISEWYPLKDIEMPHERELNKIALNRLKRRIEYRSRKYDPKCIEDLL